MLLALLGILVILGLGFTWLGMLPYTLLTALHLPRWLPLIALLLVTAWLVDD